MHLNNLISELVTFLIPWSNMRNLLVGLGNPYNLILLLDCITAANKNIQEMRLMEGQIKTCTTKVNKMAHTY